MKPPSAKVPAFELALWQIALMLASLVLVVAMITRSHAAERSLCEPRAAMDAKGHEHHAKWNEGTRDQWLYLRGIYSMNPLTPPGLPYGDTVGWWTRDGEDSSVAYFIDGMMACTPMAIPDILLKYLDQIKDGEILHPGKAL